MTLMSFGESGRTLDVFGNLKSVTLPNGNIITYLLDAKNRRVGKKINNSLVQQYIWQDDLKIAGEYNSSGSLVSEFIYATQVNAHNPASF